MTVLISASDLATALESDIPPTVVDVRWTLGNPDGHPDYLQGHIPTAVYVDLDGELAAHGPASSGRHPLPNADQLQAAARRWGVSRGRPVVVYDGAGNLAAARAWWLLRWGGVADVRILDGALPAWTVAGLPLSTDDVVPPAGNIEIRTGAMPVLTVDDVADFADEHTLLDARATERYRGDVEPIDPKAGHIPGAVSAPTGNNLAADGHFLPREELRERFAAFGDLDGPIGVYCGSGVTATHAIAALNIAGADAALYPGSWSQWSNLDLPVAIGD
ncbi:sulfurtransferase [Gordonia sp. NB41Y]|uniref:sulfurtransferase n=1 Tax=Gordonia sp. NB41Y TaxID=875808 RepID=UPI0006B198CC|nr:sulfurtransferase [Gordonia sp. NB41Y]EMP12472.2 thiosulfate sulfurtransferase [Gordonia sp. NB41Y]WLP88440.1 sulfurtransferase [Gordonia sp. NB41Y]